MDINSIIAGVQSYNQSLKKKQSPTQTGTGNFSDTLTEAQKYNALISKGAPSTAGEYAEQTFLAHEQAAGNRPTIEEAKTMYQKGFDAASSVQQSLATEEGKRQLVSEEEQEKMGNASKGWDMLNQIQSAYDNAYRANPYTFGHGFFSSAVGGGVKNFALGLMGQQEPNYAAFNTTIHTSRPIINASIMQEGKAQAGEKANVQGFEANLPSESDSPQTATAKLDALRLMQYHSIQSNIAGMRAGGRTDAANQLTNSDQYQMMENWAQSYTQRLQQQAIPNAYGPTRNNLTNEDSARLTSAVNAGKQQQPPSTPPTNPPGSVKANQAPVTAQPQQTPSAQPQQSPSDWLSNLLSGK